MIVGIGIDLVETDRLERVLRRHGSRFERRVYTPAEVVYYRDRAPELAVRFAAKEAVYKAFADDRSLGWKDMTILNDENGKPYCRLKNKNFHGTILISISHTHNYAVASAIITS